jgi:hypothetical protein
MLVTKLSPKFYEKLGDDVANELVEWFNQVDAAYRSEFHDLFEVHFARFDAKLEQRIAELRAEFDTKLGRLETRLIRWIFLFCVGTVGTLVALQKF